MTTTQDTVQTLNGHTLRIVEGGHLVHALCDTCRVRLSHNAITRKTAAAKIAKHAAKFA